MDLNIILVAGEAGLVVVDTHGSEAEGRRVVEDIRRLGVGEVTALINTHEHFDHTFGNAAFRAAYGQVPIFAHEVAAANTVESGVRSQLAYRDGPGEHYREEVLATAIVPADQSFSSTRVLDLGDRAVELVYPGRGHSGGDVVVAVPEHDVQAHQRGNDDRARARRAGGPGLRRGTAQPDRHRGGDHPRPGRSRRTTRRRLGHRAMALRC
jgi:glyoxylase-like metal-dependent hydrolase (beta-lactamase superfamily II)